MLTVCIKDYGEMTGSPHGTFYHLKFVVEYQIDVLPLQVEDYLKQNPPCGEDHLDHSNSALVSSIQCLCRVLSTLTAF